MVGGKIVEEYFTDTEIIEALAVRLPVNIANSESIAKYEMQEFNMLYQHFQANLRLSYKENFSLVHNDAAADDDDPAAAAADDDDYDDDDYDDDDDDDDDDDADDDKKQNCYI
ncbi:hypothetical protein DPMN_152574 [Dreissena polymorpha]|uniref:Uncharacterized protein n=1 Tax=Dreissena polymorpha TaxID=45954 RepID=A0A9D4FHP6_DREPO|nr:hypothetical protein DPMN_152574 [Dreissena polymorpha]